MGIGIGDRTMPTQRQPPRGKLDTRPQHGRIARQHAFDQPDTGGAIEPVDQQLELGLAPRHHARMGGEVALERRRAAGMTVLETAIEGAQSRRIDDRMGAGAARAAEHRVVTRSSQGLATMRAAAAGDSGRYRKDGDIGHLRNIRRVKA